MDADRRIPLNDDITRLVLCLDSSMPVGPGELCCAMKAHEDGGRVVLDVLRRIHEHNFDARNRAHNPAAMPLVTVVMRFPATPEGERKVEQVTRAVDGEVLLENQPLRHFKSFQHARRALQGIRPETIDHLAGEEFPNRHKPKQVTELLLTTSSEDMTAYEQTNPHDHSRVRFVYDHAAVSINEADRGHVNEIIQYVIDVGAEHNRKLGLPPPVVHVIAACSSNPAGQALEKETTAAAAHLGKAITLSVVRPIFEGSWAEYVARNERDWIRHQRQLAREDGLPVDDHQRSPALAL